MFDLNLLISCFFTLTSSAGISPGNRRNGSKILYVFDWPEETSRLGKVRAEGSAEAVRLEFSFLLKVPENPWVVSWRTVPGGRSRAGVPLLGLHQSFRSWGGLQAAYYFDDLH